MNKDRYEQALDEIRDTQGDEWCAYSAADIEAAEAQAKFPYPKGTLVRSRLYGFCTEGHVLVTTSEPRRNKSYESGYYQSAKCLICKVVVGNVDAGWWRELASTEEKARAREALESQIETLEGHIRILEAA